MQHNPAEGLNPAPNPERRHQSLPSGSVHKPLDQPCPLGADTRSKRNYNPAASLQKGDLKHRKLDKMRRPRNMLQTKKQDKNPQNQVNEEEIGNLPEKEFRVMIVKISRISEIQWTKYKKRLTRT